jgi:uroporphyrin-3 C-methyltransferase/uroporphyrinogen III methyltransferase/synthase
VANGGVVDEVLAKAWGWSKTLLLAAWSDMRRLVTIREVSNPDALLIAPSQAYFIRENLRLRMLNARLALLSRQQLMLRNDLKDARTWFVRYFDVKSPRVKDAIKTIDHLIAAQVASELPNLADSVSALRLSRTPGAR